MTEIEELKKEKALLVEQRSNLFTPLFIKFFSFFGVVIVNVLIYNFLEPLDNIWEKVINYCLIFIVFLVWVRFANQCLKLFRIELKIDLIRLKILKGKFINKKL
ncbi:hypothetical protein [Bacillus suaedaesalsae]|uniref:Cyanobacterial aminoacyl-tRNA synthetase CAAD domain-containing protein n=1 Tax=Bacillus suaedaesalsae TaxID=2810349 RepID=A0ABS2DCZ2_9BACI|nr:hypothetical protein [Bacillus suaedaesalsae]MBM6616329.1 hypothetical protein [Bacillus suaedaesalsae]